MRARKQIICLCLLVFFVLSVCSCGKEDETIPYGYVDGCKIKLEKELRDWVNGDAAADFYNVRIYVYDRYDALGYDSEMLWEADSELSYNGTYYLMLPDKIQSLDSSVDEAKKAGNYEMADKLEEEKNEMQEAYDAIISELVGTRYRYMLEWLSERGRVGRFDPNGIDVKNHKDEFILATLSKEDIWALYYEPGDYYYKITVEEQNENT